MFFPFLPYRWVEEITKEKSFVFLHDDFVRVKSFKRGESELATCSQSCEKSKLRSETFSSVESGIMQKTNIFSRKESFLELLGKKKRNYIGCDNENSWIVRYMSFYWALKLVWKTCDQTCIENLDLIHRLNFKISYQWQLPKQLKISSRTNIVSSMTFYATTCLNAY